MQLVAMLEVTKGGAVVVIVVAALGFVLCVFALAVAVLLSRRKKEGITLRLVFGLVQLETHDVGCPTCPVLAALSQVHNEVDQAQASEGRRRLSRQANDAAL
jgi:hypothetical protein